MSMSCLCMFYLMYFPWVLVSSRQWGQWYNAGFDNLNIRAIARITWYIHMSLGMLRGCSEVEISLFPCCKKSNTRMIFSIEFYYEDSMANREGITVWNCFNKIKRIDLWHCLVLLIAIALCIDQISGLGKFAHLELAAF